MTCVLKDLDAKRSGTGRKADNTITMVKVYYADYSRRLSPDLFSRYMESAGALLNGNLSRYYHWQDQHAHLYGKLLLRKALEDAGVPLSSLHLRYTSYGRPCLDNAPDFSISHSGSMAVCAISYAGTIGIDIEEIKPVEIDDFTSVFTKTEWKTIYTSANTNYWFYHFWTAKEAALKAKGTGLQWSMEAVSVEENTARIGSEEWQLTKVAIAENYSFHIASCCGMTGGMQVVETSF